MRRLLHMCVAAVMMATAWTGFAQAQKAPSTKVELQSVVTELVKRLGSKTSKDDVALMAHLPDVLMHLVTTGEKLFGDPEWVRLTADTYVPVMKTALARADLVVARKDAIGTLAYRSVHQKQPSVDLAAAVAEYGDTCSEGQQADAAVQRSCLSHRVHALFMKEYANAPADGTSYAIISGMAYATTPELRAAYTYALDKYYGMVSELAKS